MGVEHYTLRLNSQSQYSSSSTCYIVPETEIAAKIKEASLTIVDEASMKLEDNYETVKRSIRGHHEA